MRFTRGFSPSSFECWVLFAFFLMMYNAEVRTQEQNAAAKKHLPTLKAENATPLTSVSASGQR